MSSNYLTASITSEPYVYVLVEACDGVPQVLHGYQHVLDHVVLFIQSSDGLSLGQLQQGDLRRDHPSKQPAEHRVVAKGNNILEKRSFVTFPLHLFDLYLMTGFATVSVDPQHAL